MWDDDNIDLGVHIECPKATPQQQLPAVGHGFNLDTAFQIKVTKDFLFDFSREIVKHV